MHGRVTNLEGPHITFAKQLKKDKQLFVFT